MRPLTTKEDIHHIHNLPKGTFDEVTYQAVNSLITPAKGKEFKKVKLDCPFKLASLFLEIKDTRYDLNSILSTGTHLVAADGHVLIRIKHDAPTGKYDKFGSMVDDNSKYPDFSRVLQHMGEGIDIDINSYKLESLSAKVQRCVYELPEGATTGFSLDYIKKVKSIGVTELTLCTAFHKIASFKGENFEGVIMPMRA